MTAPADRNSDYQNAREEIRRSVLVSASAGTGKTSVLVDRYIHILFNNAAQIDEILAITFTEKAANEMKKRIRRALRSSVPSDATLLDRLNTAPISTIHSFCARVLQENVEEIGIDPQFRIIDEIEEQILRQENLEIYLHQELRKNDSPILQLIEYFDLFQIREMLNIAWQRQVDLLSPLARMTDTTSVELFKRYKKHHHDYTLQLLQRAFLAPELEPIYDFMKCSHAADPEDTLEQVRTALLAMIASLKANQLPPQLADHSLGQLFNLQKQGRKSNWGDELELMRQYHRQLRGIWDEIKERVFVFDDAFEEQNAGLTVHFVKLALHWIDSFRRVLNDAAVIDFNGLEILTEHFLKSRSAAAQTYARRFRHLLVDEFQDISPVQDRILTALCDLNTELVTFFVGDEKQSIYRFRGAEVEIFNDYKRRMPQLYLDENFRSIGPLNRFFNLFFTQLMSQADCAAGYDTWYDRPVRSHDVLESESLPVDLLVVKNDQNAGTNPLNLTETDAEFVHVVQRMKELEKDSDQKIVKDRYTRKLRKAEWRDFTILLRSRTHLESLERILNLAGVPYYVASGVGFYQRREVLDVIHFLRVVINCFDETALVATLRSPMVGFSDDELMEMTTEKGLMDGIRKLVNGPSDSLSIDEPLRLRFQNFWEMIQRLRHEMPLLTTAELLQTILQETDYLAVLAAFPEEHQGMANVLKLVDLAVEWSGTQDISPVDYIRRIQLYQTMQVREGEANLSSETENSVTIMTVHAAKGLAFPIVVVPELTIRRGGRHPRLLSDNSEFIAFNLKTPFNDKHSYYHQYLIQNEKDREAAEEKRILYVAATRAESYLLLSGTERADTASDAQWSKIRNIFNNAGLNTREITLTEASKGFAVLQHWSQPVVRTISASQMETIEKLIKPLSMKKTATKITPTAFSHWLSRRQEKIPPQKKYPTEEPLYSVRSLTALETGTIIHQAFSWWDFQDVETLTGITGQLLIPFGLPASEYRRWQGIFKAWGENFLKPENPLSGYIRAARSVAREVDIYAWIGGTLLEGKIDLLLSLRNGRYMVIDFKSDHIGDSPDEALLTKYNAQLALYALMLMQGSKLTVESTGLYFIRNALLIENRVDVERLRRTEEQLMTLLSHPGNVIL